MVACDDLADGQAWSTINGHPQRGNNHKINDTGDSCVCISPNVIAGDIEEEPALPTAQTVPDVTEGQHDPRR